MFSIKQTFISITAFFLVGLLAVNLCLAHPVSDDAHSSASTEESACPSEAGMTSLRPSKVLEAPAPGGPNINSLWALWSALDYTGALFDLAPDEACSPAFPVSTTKRYQINCAYLL